MASNVDQLVSELSQTLRKGAQSASDKAKQEAARFTDVLRDLADTPERALDELKRKAKSPFDWLSIMILIALQLQRACPDLKVGIWTHPNWAKGLLLTYPKVTGGVAGSLSLAFSFGGTAEEKNGFAIIVENSVEIPAGNGAFAFEASGHCNGKGTILIALDGDIEKDRSCSASALALLRLPDAVFQNQPPPGLNLTVGPIGVGGSISVTDEDLPKGLDWSITGGFPDRTDPKGLKASVNFSQFLGSLAEVIHISGIEESYRPSVDISKGKSPKFDLNHGGS